MDKYRPENLIHTTISRDLVRSKSEVIIANLLADNELGYYYEKPLKVGETNFKIPDFTIPYEGEEWYWEHLGMLDDPAYEEAWIRKKDWYKKHGFINRLIVTDERGGFDSTKIQEIINKYFKMPKSRKKT